MMNREKGKKEEEKFFVFSVSSVRSARSVFSVFIICVLCGAVLALDLRMGQQSFVENVRIPVELWPNGRPRIVLRAREAVLPQDGAVVTGKGVRIELFDVQGQMEGVVTAQELAVNLNERTGHDPGPVKFEHRNVEIEGVGFSWREDRTLLTVESNVVMTVYYDGESMVKGIQ